MRSFTTFLLKFAKATVAICVALKGLIIFVSTKIGPIDLGEDPFSIDRLPDEKIAGALFTGGADDEVWVGDALGEHVGADELICDFFSGEALLDDVLDGVADFVSATVVEGEA